jgi:hypothetical protein
MPLLLHNLIPVTIHPNTPCERLLGPRTYNAPMGCGDCSSRGLQHPGSFFPREDLRRDRERLSNFPFWKQKEVLSCWLKREELNLSLTPDLIFTIPNFALFGH